MNSLRLQLLYPGLSQLPCSECQKYVYEIPSGYPPMENGVPLKVDRGPHTPPPCDKCPKKGPEYEKDFILSWRNVIAVTLHRRVKAGMRLPAELANEPVLCDTFSLIDQVTNDAKTENDREALAASIALRLPRRY